MGPCKNCVSNFSQSAKPARYCLHHKSHHKQEAGNLAVWLATCEDLRGYALNGSGIQTESRPVTIPAVTLAAPVAALFIATLAELLWVWVKI
jgi:hypothetical protein